MQLIRSYFPNVSNQISSKYVEVNLERERVVVDQLEEAWRQEKEKKRSEARRRARVERQAPVEQKAAWKRKASGLEISRS